MEADKGFVIFFPQGFQCVIQLSLKIENYLNVQQQRNGWIIYDVCIHKAAKYIAFKNNAGEEYWMTWKAVSTV